MLSYEATCKYNEDGHTHNANMFVPAKGLIRIEYWDGHVGDYEFRYFNPAEFVSLLTRGQIWYVRQRG